MAVVNKGANFPAQVEAEIFNAVRGHSTLAKLSAQEPIPFVGKDIFTFNFSSDVAIVGESAQKPVGDGVVAPVSVQPIKVVYQMRVSDEFMTASEEYQLNVLRAFGEGFSRKIGSGLDKMAMHGVNPATGQASNIIGTNNFDSKITNVVEGTLATIDADIESALALVEGSEYTANGLAISPATRGALASLTTSDGAKKYPEFSFGATPGMLGAMTVDTNASVSSDLAITGDFEAFKWGIAKELPLEVIVYGDPDGQGDLKRNNQICLRSEAYIGWGILDENAFALVQLEA